MGLVPRPPTTLAPRAPLLLRWTRSGHVGRRRLGRVLGVDAQPGSQLDVLSSYCRQLGTGRRQLLAERGDERDEFVICGLRFDLAIEILSLQKSSRIVRGLLADPDATRTAPDRSPQPFFALGTQALNSFITSERVNAYAEGFIARLYEGVATREDLEDAIRLAEAGGDPHLADELREYRVDG